MNDGVLRWRCPVCRFVRETRPVYEYQHLPVGLMTRVCCVVPTGDALRLLLESDLEFLLMTRGAVLAIPSKNQGRKEP